MFSKFNKNWLLIAGVLALSSTLYAQVMDLRLDRPRTNDE